MSKNTIELNGKRYDALTGKVLSASPTPSPKPAVHPARRAPSARTVHVRVISDVIRPAGAATAIVPKKRVVAAKAKAAPASKAVAQTSRPKGNHIQHRQPKSAVTLVRSAVKKPEKGFKRQITVQTSLQHKVPSLIASKPSAGAIVPERLARASSVPRSSQIARHHLHSSAGIPVTLGPIPVQTPPAKPIEQGAPAPQSTNKPENIFEHAMKNASNFRELPNHKHFKKRTRRHLASMAAGGFALVALTGFLAYQNTPGLQLKVAGIQAGFSTNMPNFQAAGFAYTGVKSSDDKVTVGFSSQQGTYTLTEQSTNWSNTDMIRNIGTNQPSGEPSYSQIKAGDSTVYRLSNNSATWVSGGTWYQVSGDHNLTDSQVKALVDNI